MKIVKVKMKKGVTRVIRDDFKDYDYICFLKNIEVGDYVLVDVFIHNQDTFGVARIEEIYQLTAKEAEAKGIYGFVILKLPETFEEHCNRMKKIKIDVLRKREGTYRYINNRKKKVKTQETNETKAEE